MNELEFLQKMAKISAQVRHYQVQYFATRSGAILKVCKDLERQLDELHLQYANGSYSQAKLELV